MNASYDCECKNEAELRVAWESYTDFFGITYDRVEQSANEAKHLRLSYAQNNNVKLQIFAEGWDDKWLAYGDVKDGDRLKVTTNMEGWTVFLNDGEVARGP